ncbi:hypothetical protein, partial [Sutterella sp.]|uniref:hypothetical protein n=1 Tax=Sutterella sp. TaxID=1981025 RepID=UPI0026E048B4
MMTFCAFYLPDTDWYRSRFEAELARPCPSPYRMADDLDDIRDGAITDVTDIPAELDADAVAEFLDLNLLSADLDIWNSTFVGVVRALRELLDLGRNSDVRACATHSRLLAEAWLGLGECARAREEAERAVRILSEGGPLGLEWYSRSERSEARAWLVAAKLRASAGEREAALEAARRALELGGGRPEYVRVLGQIEAGASLAEMEFGFGDLTPVEMIDELKVYYDVTDERGCDRYYVNRCARVLDLTPDRAGIEERLAILGRHGLTDWIGPDLPDRDWCGGTIVVAGRPHRIRFYMTEAGFARLPKRLLRSLLASLADDPELGKDAVICFNEMGGMRFEPENRWNGLEDRWERWNRQDESPAASQLVAIAGTPAGRTFLTADDVKLLTAIAEMDEACDWSRLPAFMKETAGTPVSPVVAGELAAAFNNLARPADTRFPSYIDQHTYLDAQIPARQAEEALELLESCGTALENTWAWNFRMGYAFTILNRPGEAGHFLERALRMRPLDAGTAGLLARAVGAVSGDEPVSPLVERLFLFGKRLAAEAAGLSECLRANPAEGVARLRELFFELGTGWFVDAAVSPDDGRIEVVISPRGCRVEIPMVLEVVRHLGEVVPEWRFLAGRRAGGRGETVGEPDLLKLDADRIFVRMVPRNGRWEAEFRLENCEPVSRHEGRGLFSDAIMNEIVGRIGEAAMMRFIAGLAVHVHPGREPGREPGMMPLAELAGWFARYVPESVGFGLEDVLRSEKTEYFVKPVGEGFLEDVTDGWTRFPELRAGFLGKRPEVCDRIVALGVTVGCIVLDF